MIKRILTSKKALFWMLFGLVVAICLGTLGTTFAWMYNSTQSQSTKKAASVGMSMSVDGVINFELDSNIVGLAGDTVAVTRLNEILTGSYTDPYIYKVEYSVVNGSAAHISGMHLLPEKVSELGLIEHGGVIKPNEVRVVYYGVNSSVQNLDMGALQVEFKEATNEDADDDLYINVEVVSCQRTKDAFMDAYGIAEKDISKFMPLLEQ